MDKRIWAEISLERIKDNYDNIKQHLPKQTQVMAIVKADGYGHGAVPVAAMLQELDYIWGFGVATVPEALQLRESNISKPILVLGFVFEQDYKVLIEQEIRPTVFKVEMAEKLSHLAVEMQKDIPIHIKIDTGMSRLGFSDSAESVAKIRHLCDLPGLLLEGVFTHLACADEMDKTSARTQLRRYTNLIKQLEQSGVVIPFKHCANSAAAMELPEAAFDLVRIGISGYGIYPSEEVMRAKIRLTPAMALKSRIAFVKDIGAGVPISYGGTFVTPEPMKVATIPAGYADGYPRSLSSLGSVLIRGQRAPILGRICMDQLMVDVSGIDGVEELDEVILMGDEITVDELGRLSGKFPYEFVCGIGKRVPRIYISADT